MFGRKKKTDKVDEKKEETDKETIVPEKSEKEKQEEIKQKLSKGFLKCHFVFEIVGKPPEYIEQIMELLIQQLEKEQNVQVLTKSFNKSANYQDSKDLFTTFAETELLVENFRRLIEIIFDYMPTSIEIQEPEEIKIKSHDLNLLANELATNLHHRDIATKKIMFEKDVLFKKLQEMNKSPEPKTENKN
jgi:hypothetical protein